MVLFENTDIVNDFLTNPFPVDRVTERLSIIAKEITDLQIGVIFVDQYVIRKLNKEFRREDKPTDVLSFEPSFEEIELIRTDQGRESIGEVYICPKYIIDSLDDRYGKYDESRLLEEIFRMMIHGILHIGGREHSTHLDYGGESESNEPMYIEQERLLKNLMNELESIK